MPQVMEEERGSESPCFQDQVTQLINSKAEIRTQHGVTPLWLWLGSTKLPPW